jgi:subtilisin family serine protease
VIPNPTFAATTAADDPQSTRRRVAAAMSTGGSDHQGIRDIMNRAADAPRRVGAASAFEVPSVQDILDRRRVALSMFAADIATGTAKGLSTLRAERRVGTAATASTAGGSLSVKSLPSLGAIIMDEELVDRHAAERGWGATIFENFVIPLVTPSSWIGQRMTMPSASVDAWHLSDINVAAARSKGLTGSGVLVGVLDTGVDAAHPELGGRVRAFQEFDMNGVEVTSNAHDPGDHGTHVCGLIAGSSCGVAPDAELAVASVLTEETPDGYAGYLVQIAAGLDWLLTSNFRGTGDPGVDLLSASLGGTGYDDYLYQPLADARLTTGTLMIAAIGNAGRRGANHHGSPANYDLCVGVGASDRNGTVARFSDWGTVSQHKSISKPDICAPGAGVWSSVPGGEYEAMDGTSMATPIVAGAAALLLQQNAALGASADGLRNALLNLSTTPPRGSRAGRGRLDLTNI